jgi:hypothetical protein
MIHYSHTMTCLMAYHNKKGSEAISIVLQTIIAAIWRSNYRDRYLYAIRAIRDSTVLNISWKFSE